jgi:hypothetical protein
MEYVISFLGIQFLLLVTQPRQLPYRTDQPVGPRYRGFSLGQLESTHKTSTMPRDAELFIAIAIFELTALFVLFQYTSRRWPRIAGAFAVAFTAAIVRNVYYGPGINRETVAMSVIHAATVTVLFTLVFLIKWKLRK